MTWRRAVGLAMGFAGVLVVLGSWRGVGGGTLTGQLMCFAAAACNGVAIPYFKRFVAGGAESGLAIAAVQVLMSTVVLAVAAPPSSRAAGGPDKPCRWTSSVWSCSASGWSGTNRSVRSWYWPGSAAPKACSPSPVLTARIRPAMIMGKRRS